jgi:hypothetical protein
MMASACGYGRGETCELAVIRLFAFGRSTGEPSRMTCSQ